MQPANVRGIPCRPLGAQGVFVLFACVDRVGVHHVALARFKLIDLFRPERKEVNPIT